MIAPRQPTPTPATAVHRHPRGGPWPPGGVSWVGGRARLVARLKSAGNGPSRQHSQTASCC